MDAAQVGWRRLGAVLVDARLVSEHDLLAALAEQERTGQRLGEILVERGVVSAAAVANALAEQYGRFLKTEHGFGTGLRAVTEQTGPPDSRAAELEPPPLSIDEPGEPQLSAVDADQETLSQERQRVSEAESGPDQDRGHLLLVPTPRGYLLLQRSGDAPAPGDILELEEVPDVRLRVAKLAGSPLPQDRRACAYLHPV